MVIDHHVLYNTLMNTFFTSVLLVLSVIIVILILIQGRGAGLGSAWGGGGEQFATRRGIEKWIMWATALLIFLFLVVAIILRII
ncbi:MAG: preprotein translocase subunit SecG [Microgenomates bacterium OLB22]|nr:MAG: preprotein translocase subunit SecG [Microgenomates bacterium OLB22]